MGHRLRTKWPPRKRVQALPNRGKMGCRCWKQPPQNNIELEEFHTSLFQIYTHTQQDTHLAPTQTTTCQVATWGHIYNVFYVFMGSPPWKRSRNSPGPDNLSQSLSSSSKSNLDYVSVSEPWVISFVRCHDLQLELTLKRSQVPPWCLSSLVCGNHGSGSHSQGCDCLT